MHNIYKGINFFTKKHYSFDVNKFSKKNLEATSKFYVLEWCHDTSVMLRTHKYYAPPYKELFTEAKWYP